ncbi:hypothetical protein [Bradyrhizobium sp. CB3481]|uniref:hypothetical protein n=1 Tax=Bradyrhizobium sp. CB3481 TaxID=3039158 RepID=UPI0024B1514D|nr:hypothetical protein [Bradyrhizobium sp. CB3481]WFU14697.1 hypothetical protein QA643_26935 [Bradyrhizobium sp. CB3481]
MSSEEPPRPEQWQRCRPKSCPMRLARLILIHAPFIPLMLGNAMAANINVALAANFAESAKEIAASFKQKTWEDPMVSFRASGGLCSQFTQGASFQMFPSANGPSGSRFLVPKKLYIPTPQGPVLVKICANSNVTRGLVNFFKTPETHSLVGRNG